MTLAVVLILLVVGSVVFHFWSPWWFSPIASNWGTIDDTIIITFWVTGIVFVAVNLFVAYAVIRYRARPGQKAAYEPESKKLELWLTIITGVGVAAMLTPGLFVWANFVQVPDDATEFEALGQQWNWRFRVPGEDGVMGTSDATFIDQQNPFGLTPDDPDAQDDLLIQGGPLHLLVDQPTAMLLRSKDVLHDFAVPQFRVKMDAVPGMVTYAWFTPTVIGEYEILCEELCGIAHHLMRSRVVVDEQASYDAWIETLPTFAETMAAVPGDPAAGQPLYAACGACHGAQGEGIQLLNSPKLSGQEDWYLKRQINNYKQGRRGTHQDDLFGMQMAPMAGTLFDEAAIDNVIAYIGTLPDTPAEATVTGDAERGESLYETCGTCHGADGKGNWGVSAPRQAGMSDWYLVNQLKNFKRNIRGGHPHDAYGGQMAEMAKILGDDEAINDVVAYINTL
jgi:cytochrome c oxidase subunit 2